MDQTVCGTGGLTARLRLYEKQESPVAGKRVLYVFYFRLDCSSRNHMASRHIAGLDLLERPYVLLLTRAGQCQNGYHGSTFPATSTPVGCSYTVYIDWLCHTVIAQGWDVGSMLRAREMEEDYRATACERVLHIFGEFCLCLCCWCWSFHCRMTTEANLSMGLSSIITDLRVVARGI